jgi:hypothetical protein
MADLQLKQSVAELLIPVKEALEYSVIKLQG